MSRGPSFRARTLVILSLDGFVMNSQTLFRHLVLMAAADGKFTTEEVALLADKAAEVGLSSDELARIIEQTATTEAMPALPTSRGERLQMAEELLRMMAADGHLEPVEKRLFATLAGEMELDSAQINMLIDRVTIDLP